MFDTDIRFPQTIQQKMDINSDINIHVPNTIETLNEMQTLRETIRNDLISYQIMNLQPFDCEVIIAVWEDRAKFTYICQIAVNTKNKKYCRHFEIDSFLKEDELNREVWGCVKQVIEEILNDFSIKTIRRLKAEYLNYRKIV